MGILDRLIGRKKSPEGAWSAGPYLLDSGWLPAGTPVNFWQMGQNPTSLGAGSAMVEACVSAYAQTVAMCPGTHWRRLANGGRMRVEGSPLTAIIAAPNRYMTFSDFLLNGVRELYLTGNMYALAVRGARNEIEELHLMQTRSCAAMVGEDGDIFYSLGGNPIAERRFGTMIVPARDVLHVRLHAGRDPLRGESPLVAAALDVSANNQALSQQLAFLLNQAKPSIMLTTDSILTRDQVKELRASWDAQTRGEYAGGTPILTAGLKPSVVATSAVDAQVAELMKLSDEHIALAFRVPLQVLGIGGAPYASTELLMQSWIASGLGFVLNHIEEAMGRLFGLAGFPGEYVEFSTTALQRSAFRDRVEAMARSTISGIHSPDEARNDLDLPVVPGGHGAEPRVQQQVVPLSYWDKQAAMNAPAPEVDETDKLASALRLKALEAVHGNRH